MKTANLFSAETPPDLTALALTSLSFVCSWSNPLANGLVDFSQFYYLRSLQTNVRLSLAWPYRGGRDQLTCQTGCVKNAPERKGIR